MATCDLLERFDKRGHLHRDRPLGVLHRET